MVSDLYRHNTYSLVSDFLFNLFFSSMDLPRYGAHHQDEGKSTMERYAKYVEIDAVTVCST